MSPVIKKVTLLVGRKECGSADWTAIPTLAVKLQHGARVSLKRLKSGEKIRISCEQSQEVVVFSKNNAVFTKNLIEGLCELDALLRQRPLHVFSLRDFAML